MVKHESRKGEERVDFCIECRRETGYLLRKREIPKTIRDKEYTFSVTVAVCKECGEEMSIPGLIDKNAKEIDEQYRAFEGLVTLEDIGKLLQIYDLGKEPASLALGFGAITITRYLAGQVPSKEYSDVIRKALSSPVYMKKKLLENGGKISETALRKSLVAVENMIKLFSVSAKMQQVIAALFAKIEEITPLALQKLLYFTQGIYLAAHGKPLFDEDCFAWAHGPVYPKVYRLFKDFKFNPIDDARFACLKGADGALTADEMEIVDLVAATFGMYSGKALEKITHTEAPWLDARGDNAAASASGEVIRKESMREYFETVASRYEIRAERGPSRYISDKMMSGSKA